MLNLVSHNLKQYHAAHYFIGFSGGRDSLVLLDLLCHLRDSNDLNAPLIAIHVNHNLSKKSPNWVKHCQKICEAYSLPIIIETINDKPKVGESIEAFAREARYRLIEKHLSKNDIFLSAHHQRDQAETFLLQLMRGAGLDGLRAMPKMRKLGVGRYLRPLLDVPFADIVAYAEDKKLNSIEDDSNADIRFDRNYLRHKVFPVLEKRFPQASTNISQSAMWLSEVPEVLLPKQLMIADLLVLSDVQQKQQIRTFVKSKVGQALSKTQTQYLLSHHMTAAADKHPSLLVGDYVVRRFDGEITVTALLPQLFEQMLTVNAGQDINVSPLASLQWEIGQGLIVEQPLTLKPLVGSERFHLHTRHRANTVKKILHEAKIPTWLRPYYCGLYVDNELLAIPGVGVARNHFHKSTNALLPLWIIEDKFVRI